MYIYIHKYLKQKYFNKPKNV